MSVIICAINCGQIILVQLIYCFYIFHYFSLFLSLLSLFSFCCKKCFIFTILLCCSEMCFHSFTSSNILMLCCFIPLGSTDGLVVILHLECSTQNFWGVCVTWQSLGDIWVIFRSPRVTYYTGNMFGFNVNYSYLYLFKI